MNRLEPFKHKVFDLFVPFDYKYKYEPLRKLSTRHIGRIKLWEMTTNWLMSNDFPNNNNQRLIYIGAGMATSIIELVKSYPNVTYDLWDPLDTFSYELRRMAQNGYDINFYPCIYPQSFGNGFGAPTEADYSNLGQTKWYLNDVRRDLINKDDQASIDYDSRIIDEDLINQADWGANMGADYGCLKFTLPYAQSSLARRLDWKYQSIEGDLHFQTCLSQKGTETRMWCTGPQFNTIEEYDIKDYEGALYYYNSKIRCRVFSNKCSETALSHFKCSCHDCCKLISTLYKLPSGDRKNHLLWIKKEMNKSLRVDHLCPGSM